MLTVNLSLDKSGINPYISSTLLKKIEENLSAWKKIILYLNKRWEYSSLVCQDCQHIFKCPACDISLSVHKHPEKLACHLCWYNSTIPLRCEKCSGTHLLKIWVGTQQIEKCLSDYLSSEKCKIYRFDLDNIKNISSKKEALEHLKNADIIIWTKMITTGFDFKKVWLVWVILLEQELIIPNYDTEEKAYINIKQIIGRGERLGEKTDFIMQSFIPDNDLIKWLIEHNYKDFFKKTLEERKIFSYPPFVEMATLEYRDTNQEKAKNFMENLKNKLDIECKEESEKWKVIEVVLNSTPRKKYNQYHYKIIIKWNNLRDFLQEIKPEIMRNSKLSVSFY